MIKAWGFNFAPLQEDMSLAKKDIIVSHRSIETKFLNETKPSTFFHQNIKLRRLRSEVELETRIFKNGPGRFNLSDRLTSRRRSPLEVICT